MSEAIHRALRALGNFPDRAKIESLCMLVEDVLSEPTTLAGVAVLFIGQLQIADASCKLPILYSIDFIAKKLGLPFQDALRPFIADAVVSAHAILPPQLSLKIRSMVGTWVDQKVFASETAAIQARLAAASAGAPSSVQQAFAPPPSSSFVAPTAPAASVAQPGYGQKVPFAATGIGAPATASASLLGAGPQPHHPPQQGGPPPAKRPRFDADANGSVSSSTSGGAMASQAPPALAAPAAAGAGAGSTLGRLLAGLKGGPAAATSATSATPSSSATPIAGGALGSAGIPSFFPNVATPASVLPSVGYCAVPAIDATGRPMVTPEPPIQLPPGTIIRDNLVLPSILMQGQQQQQLQQPDGDSGGAPAAPIFPIFVTLEPEDAYHEALVTEISSALQSILALSSKNGFAVNCLYARQLLRCGDCGVRFRSPKDLQQHEKIHAGDPLLPLAGSSSSSASSSSSNRAPIISRQWYSPEEPWMRNDGKGGNAARAAEAAGNSTGTTGGGSGGAASGGEGAAASAGGVEGSGAAGGAALASASASGASGGGAALGAGAQSPGAMSSDSNDSDHHVVTAFDPTATCAVCGEGFDRKWDEELETFVLKGAVSIAGELYHRSCGSSLDPASSAASAGGARRTI